MDRNALSGNGGWIRENTVITTAWRTIRGTGTGCTAPDIITTANGHNGSSMVFLLDGRYNGIRRITGGLQFQLSPRGIPSRGIGGTGRRVGIQGHRPNRPQQPRRYRAGTHGSQKTLHPVHSSLPA